MTRRLILIRHAKSSWGDPTLDDHERPLNKRGRAAADAIGTWLRRKSYLPDSILSSSALRTRETADLLNLSVPVKTTRDLYHAHATSMLSVLRESRDKAVLMIGHNPGIAELAERLERVAPDKIQYSHAVRPVIPCL